MSIWGHGLYQTDSDLDTLDLIADEAAKMFSDPECLCCPLIPEYYSLRSPIDKAATVTQLNEGTFYRLLRRFKNSKNDMAVILLAAVGMELGVNFQEEDTLMVKMTVMKADIGDEKREQMIAALEGYKNDGTVWDFQKKGSVETVGSSMKEEVNENQDAAKAEGGESPIVWPLIRLLMILQRSPNLRLKPRSRLRNQQPRRRRKRLLRVPTKRPKATIQAWI